LESATSLYNLWQSYDLYPEFITRQFGSRSDTTHKENKLTTTTQKHHTVIPPVMFPYIEHRALYDEYGEVIFYLLIYLFILLFIYLFVCFFSF
jgi:hypothetical protein